MSKTHIVIPDPHALPGKHNHRATWLICDVRPDVVINLGDTADMESLSGYDRGKLGFHGRTYKKDIEAHNDFQDRLWLQVKKQKRKLPTRYTLIGNHEQRIERAVNANHELQGTVSYDDLQLDRYYNEVIHYQGGTPGVVEVDGIHYAHYFSSGVMGRAIGGEHPAYSLLTKKFVSCTQGHTHTFDHCIRTTANGRKITGLVAGVFQDYISEWAGEANKMWEPGVAIKRNVEDGRYDLQWIGIDALKKTYGHLTKGCK